MGFQKTVLYVAVVVLVLSLMFTAVALYVSNGDYNYPPVASDCPDYWITTGAPGTEICTNVHRVGNYGDDKCTHVPEKGGICAKYKWANDCKMTWNGITNSPKSNKCV